MAVAISFQLWRSRTVTDGVLCRLSQGGDHRVSRCPWGFPGLRSGPCAADPYSFSSLLVTVDGLSSLLPPHVLRLPPSADFFRSLTEGAAKPPSLLSERLGEMGLGRLHSGGMHSTGSWKLFSLRKEMKRKESSRSFPSSPGAQQWGLGTNPGRIVAEA